MEIKKSLLSVALASVLAVGFSGCEPASDTDTSTDITLEGSISSDMTLDASKKYKISGTVKVTSGATLTIPAGTILYGATATSYLSVDRGGKIVANGTEANPVKFTSAEGVAGSTEAPGQWGGLTICGKAPIQDTASSSEATDFAYEADSTLVCGKSSTETSLATDNSGTLSYVVIKNTGYTVTSNAELNGLSLLGIGNGTTIDHVASINGGDDGVEIWGGTVNLSNIYIYNAGDDGFDLDAGYKGTTTNLYVEHGSESEPGHTGFEISNQGNTSFLASIRTTPTISNFTISANATPTKTNQAILLKEGGNATFTNGLIYHSSTETAKGTQAINVDHDNTTSATGLGNYTNVHIVTTATSNIFFTDTDGDKTSSLPSGLTYATSNNSSATGAPAALKTWGDQYK